MRTPSRSSTAIPIQTRRPRRAARVALAFVALVVAPGLLHALGPAFRPAVRPALAQGDQPTATATVAGSATPASSATAASSTTPSPSATAAPPTASPTARPPGRLKNISTRAYIGKRPHEGLIAGFIIAGGTARVLVRALGPSLTVLGVPGALPDPYVSIYSGARIVAENDNWSGDPEVVATGLSPAHPNDAALVRILAPGPYTAVVAPARPSIGVALVEVFFVSGEGRLTNLSTRGQVLTGDNVLIGGFIIREGPLRVLVRAIGPNLANHGVPGVLANPLVSLFEQSTLLVENDDWGTRPEAGEMQAAGAAPASPLESAMMVPLQDRSYTGIVRGVGSTGIGLIEVFSLSPP